MGRFPTLQRRTEQRRLFEREGWSRALRSPECRSLRMNGANSAVAWPVGSKVSVSSRQVTVTTHVELRGALRIAAETSVTNGAVSDPPATHGERRLFEREGLWRALRSLEYRSSRTKGARSTLASPLGSRGRERFPEHVSRGTRDASRLTLFHVNRVLTGVPEETRPGKRPPASEQACCPFLLALAPRGFGAPSFNTRAHRARRSSRASLQGRKPPHS